MRNSERVFQVDPEGNAEEKDPERIALIESLSQNFQMALEQGDEYSGTFNINPDMTVQGHVPQYGTGMHITVNGKRVPQMLKLGRVEDVYKLFQEINESHPEYEFSFSTDPEQIKWIKYTVRESENNNTEE